jgi:crotonobetainyl-CoA:carnitine CoA-transferase CaiB-like acyl-CoA transferase
VGALAALHERNTSGLGQVVDSAIYEAVLAMMESTVPEYTEAGLIRERSGSILPKTAPSNVYPTRGTEMIVMGANQDSVFRRLAQAMEQPELADDERFRDHVARGEHQQELDDLISAWSSTLDADELLAVLERESVPAGRIYRAPDMLEDPQYQARDSIIAVEHPEFENIKMQNVFPRMSRTQGTVRWPGPALGAHSDEVYGELLGLTVEQLARLRDDSVV